MFRSKFRPASLKSQLYFFLRYFFLSSIASLFSYFFLCYFCHSHHSPSVLCPTANTTTSSHLFSPLASVLCPVSVAQVVDSMSNICPILTIGPTIPSIYLDNRVSSDQEYGLNLFHFDPATSMNWLNSRPQASTVYVAFGSMVNLNKIQMEEIAWGLKNTNYHFIWVVKTSDQENIPQEFAREIGDKGIFVNWSPQLKVLSHKAIGCFFSHGGWNSTIEALSLGVPMVLMPQWTDQPTNTKLVQDVWKTGVRVRVEENGVVGRQEIEDCIKEVMEGEKGKEMKKNAVAWSHLAKQAVSEGGTSDMNINEFISKLEVQDG